MSDVSDLIADARSYASQAITAGVNAMGGASAALSNLGHIITVDPMKNLSLVIKPPAPGDPGDVPEYTGTHFDVDDPTEIVGKPPTLSNVADLQLPPDIVPPPPDLIYVEPLPPSGLTPNTDLLSDVPTADALPDLPVTPDLQAEIAGIVAPPLIAVDIPTAPLYVAPEFDGTRPTLDADAPTDLDAQMRAAYSDAAPAFVSAVSGQLDAFMASKFPGFKAGMAAIEARLAVYLAGGSALSPAVEDAMMTRARDRADEELVRAMDTAMKRGARTGFTIPPATLLSQSIDLDKGRRDANIKVAIEVYVEQARLEQSNLQFAVTQSTNLRKIALDASLAYYTGLVTLNGQALEYARAVVDAVVRSFDIAARYAEIRARIYEADASVYRAKLEGALANIQAYEAVIRGEEAKVNVNRAQVDAYRARLDAIRIESDVYRAAVESVVAIAGLQRIKVELYDAKVKAFASQVSAFTAQYSAYEAAVRGQSARMEVNVAHSREFEARANAYTAVVRGKTAAVETAIAKNKALVDVYRARVDAYGAIEHAKAEAVRIDVGAYSATVEAYRAKSQAISDNSRAIIANYDVALRSLIAQANINLEQLKEFNHLDIVRATGLADVAEKVGAQYGSLAQAALNGMNTLAASVATTST